MGEGGGGLGRGTWVQGGLQLKMASSEDWTNETDEKDEEKIYEQFGKDLMKDMVASDYNKIEENFK